MVRPIVLTVLCWFAASIPATVIVARLVGGHSAMPKVPTSPTADEQPKDLEPTSL